MEYGIVQYILGYKTWSSTLYSKVQSQPRREFYCSVKVGALLVIAGSSNRHEERHRARPVERGRAPRMAREESTASSARRPQQAPVRSLFSLPLSLPLPPPPLCARFSLAHRLQVHCSICLRSPSSLDLLIFSFLVNVYICYGRPMLLTLNYVHGINFYITIYFLLIVNFIGFLSYLYPSPG